MIFAIFQWTTAALSLTGVVLNIRRVRACFYVWAVTNAAWAAVDAWYGAQAAQQVAYFALAIWGIVAWKRQT